MEATAEPRGIRNNNPGNLKFNAYDKWQGLATPPSDGEFFIFANPTYGIRAAARTLIVYQDKHGCKTIADFIGRWAPDSENDTDAYVAAVAGHMAVSAVAAIDVHQYGYMRSMVEAIIEQENGGAWTKYYTSDQLDKALTLAGVEGPKPSLAATGQMVGGAVAVGGTFMTFILAQLQQIKDTLEPFTGTAGMLQYASVAITLAGIGLSIWTKYKERKKGIS